MHQYSVEFSGNGKTVRSISREYGVPEFEVLKALEGDKLARLYAKDRVKDMLNAFVRLGELMILIEKDGSIFEIKSVFPAGSEGHGFYNLGKGCFSGHLNVNKIENAAAVSEIFFGKRSCSWRFFNEKGDAVFNVYVSRDGGGQHIKEQLDAFEKWGKL
jgi:putative heme utilization carrier protein HutX